MRVDLMDLLAERPIGHPTRIERAVIRRDRIELVVSGHPWWSDADVGGPSPRITLVFEELSGGELPVCLNDWVEAAGRGGVGPTRDAANILQRPAA